MRITFLLTQSLDSPSGLGRYWPLAKELVKLGHSIVILALHPNFAGLGERAFCQEGVSVRYVGQMHVRKQGSRKSYFGPLRLLVTTLWSTLCLMWAALAMPTDIYHLGKPHPMNGVAGLIASRVKRKPLYLDCDDYEAASNRFSGRWQQRIVAFFEDRLPRYAKGVTVNTTFMAERVAGLGYPAERIRYVSNGVDRGRFAEAGLSPSRATAPAAVAEGRGDDGNTVVYVGSVSYTSHAVDLLVQAFAELLRSVPGARLILVGGGENLEDLRHLVDDLGVGDSVELVGRVEQDRVCDYYRLADLTVDPVRDDLASKARCPLKLFESWAVGVPCVTGDVGDRRALMGYPMAGRLAVAGDAASLAQEMLALITDPTERRSARLACRQRVEGHYWDQLIREFTEVYRV